MTTDVTRVNIDVMIVLWVLGGLLAIGVALLPILVLLLIRNTTESVRSEALRVHTLLSDHLANPSAEDTPGAQQAISDALACYEAATRQATTATAVADWELVRVLSHLGLGFLGPFSADSLPPDTAARPWIGTPGSRPLVPPKPSDQPTNQTPYYHPGGVVDGHQVLRGWYASPWWSDSLRSGPYRLPGSATAIIGAAAAAAAASAGPSIAGGGGGAGGGAGVAG